MMNRVPDVDVSLLDDRVRRERCGVEDGIKVLMMFDLDSTQLARHSSHTSTRPKARAVLAGDTD